MRARVCKIKPEESRSRKYTLSDNLLRVKSVSERNKIFVEDIITTTTATTTTATSNNPINYVSYNYNSFEFNSLFLRAY
jgi:hypothetical protein